MKWTYSIQNKMVASAALFTLCLLVLLSNHMDQEHTTDVKNAISTLYEDRLIVEDYILKMTNDIYQIKEALSTPDLNRDSANARITKLLFDISELRKSYLKTKLTENEDIKFAELEKTLQEFEAVSVTNTPFKLENANKALGLLNELSAIQLAESKLIMNQAEKLYISGKASSQFAFALIIIILVVLQALVFASKTLRKGQVSDPNLN